MPQNESSGQSPRIGFRRISGFVLTLYVVSPIVVAALILTVLLTRSRLNQLNIERFRSQLAFVRDLELRGGRALFRNGTVITSRSSRTRESSDRSLTTSATEVIALRFLSPDDNSGTPQSLLTVDLRDVAVDTEFIERLTEFTTIERLETNGIQLTSEQFRALGRLTKLRELSLANSNLTDQDIPFEGIQPKELSLANTSISDTGLSRLVGMTNLEVLDISGTSVSAHGIDAVQRFASLRTLDVDATCITPDSVAAFRSMKRLRYIRVHVTNGSGRQIRDMMSPLAGQATVEGLNAGGQVLWNVTSPWNETLAGVVEVVEQEVDMNEREVAQLILALVAPLDLQRQRPNDHIIQREFQKTGNEIESIGEFLQLLVDSQNPSYEVRAFARDRFTKTHVPDLLVALRDHPDLRAPKYPYLYLFGAYLLVRDGLPDPDSAQELTRLLSHEDPMVRGIAAFGFDRDAHPFHDDWVPSQAAVEFGFPWLIKLSTDADRGVRLTVSQVLGDLVYHHPERASEALTVLIGMHEQWVWGYVTSSIKRIVKVNPEAARAAIPQIRSLLEEIDAGTITVTVQGTSHGSRLRDLVLEALCEIARIDPEAAHEFAVEYLRQIRDGRSDGSRLPTLVTPENSNAVRLIVHELLEISAGDDHPAELARRAIGLVAVAIRNMRQP